MDASTSIQLSILLDFGMNDIHNVVEINEDKDFAWFFTLIKDQNIRHHLVAHVIDMCLESSSVVTSGSDKLLSIVFSSSMIDSDFQVITCIFIY